MLQLGVTLALISAVLFGAGTMTARRALVGADTLIGSMVTIVVGLPILLLSSALSGELSNVSGLKVYGIAILGLAGLTNFFFGRLVMFRAIQLVGANRTHSLTTTAPVYASVLAIVFLNEAVTIFTVAAIATIVLGTYLLSNTGNTSGGLKTSREDFNKGVTLALLCSVLFGLAHFFTGLGVESVQPIIGAVISYGFAGAGYLSVLVSARARRLTEAREDFRSALRPFTLPGLFNGLALIFSYTAFAVSPVVLVSPVLSTQSLFTVLFSYLVIRKLEVFNMSVLLGSLLVVLGVIILYLPNLT